MPLASTATGGAMRGYWVGALTSGVGAGSTIGNANFRQLPQDQSSMLGPGASPGNRWAGARPVGSAAGVIRRRGRMSEAPAEFQVYKRARAFGARRECAFRKTGPILAGYAP